VISADDLRAMFGAIGTHRIVPVVDRVFGFEDLPLALDYLASGRHFGKVCVRV
jgi:NADPH:quinone reductase-like Zn-dependent oxidoreductase